MDRRRLHTITFSQKRKESDWKRTKIRSTSCQRKCTKKWSRMEWVDGDDSLLYLKSKFCATLHLHWMCRCGVRHQRNCVYANCLAAIQQDRIAWPRQTSNRRSQRRAKFFFRCCSGYPTPYGMNRNLFLPFHFNSICQRRMAYKICLSAECPNGTKVKATRVQTRFRLP